MHWTDEYPHDIWASVLLNKDREILDWKIGNYRKEFGDWTIRTEYMYKTEHAVFECKNDIDHELAFNEWSRDFFKSYKIAEGFTGSKPY